MIRGACLLSLLAICAGPVSAQSVPPLLPADGLDNPSLAIGLSGVADWGTARPFVNQMFTAREWFAAAGGEWSSMEAAELRAGDYIDDEGWVRAMPDGMDTIRTIWAYPDIGAEERAGTYILTYKGEGRITLGGDARRLDARPGRIVFATEGKSFWLNISEIDPRGKGNYLRDIVIVAEEDVPLHEAGVVFRPAWIDGIKDARVLRLLNWQPVTNSRIKPGDLPLIEAKGLWRMKGQGVPLSLLVDLVNLVGAEPWFCMPHNADDAYVTAFAEYAYAHVNPELRVHVEYSNEVWNDIFSQTLWLRDQAASQWGLPNGYDGGVAFGVREATRDALLWEDVFGADATTRLNNVLSTQTGNFWGTGIVLDPQAWAEAEPDSYMPPATVFDSLGVTVYFGGIYILDPEHRAEFVNLLKTDRAAARRWMTAKLSDATISDSPLALTEQLGKLRTLANDAGLDLVAYEGGQHLNHGGVVYGLEQADADLVTRFLVDYVRGPEMAALTTVNWDGWQRYGQGPYMHYGDTEAGGRWGSFSLYEFPGRLNPSAELLLDRNATVAPWWGEGGSDKYLQGLLLRGNDGPNALSGTVKSDILLAGAGDDLLNPGPGNDHLHGGDGADTVVLPALAAEVTFRPDGPRMLAEAPSGLYRLFSVERVRFSDGSEISTPSP